MKWKLAVLPAAVMSVALSGFTSPAQAAVPRIPFTCGMTVTFDAVVYLKKSVTCTTEFGIEVYRARDAYYLDPSPTVTIDLNGKTLRGSGVGRGVDGYDYPFDGSTTVRNGVITNWGAGVVGSGGTRVKGVKFVKNRSGMVCGDSDCSADRSAFFFNEMGFLAAFDAGGEVTRSAFVGNQTGARTEGFSDLVIDSSTFVKNKVGASSAYYLRVSRTKFLKNGTGVAMDAEGAFGGTGCADLTKVVFKANKRNLIGERCSAGGS